MFAADDAVTYANPAAGTLLHTKPGQLLGLSFADIAFIRVADGRQLKDLRRWARARAASTQTQFLRLGRVSGHPTVGTRVTTLREAGEVRYAVSFWVPSRTASAEEALANILDSASDPVIVVDDDLVIDHANHAASEAFAPTDAPLVGQPFSRVLAEPLTEDDRRFIRGEPGGAGRPRVRNHRLFRCRSADGIEFTAEGAVSHTQHRDRRIHTVILRDVSARMAELEKVRQEMGLHRVVLDNMVAALAAFDADDRLVAFNHRFLEMLGYQEGEVRVGMARTDLVRIAAARGVYGPGDPEEFVRRRNAIRHSQRFAFDEMELADGRTITIRRNRLPGGGTVATFRDVTERRGQAAALQDALARLQGASAVQASILDALPSKVALLDEHGTIVAVNEAWRKSARESGLDENDCGVGSDYLEIARLTFTGPAERASDGVRDVLDGRQDLFSFEYASHTPDGPRWFIMVVAPVGGSQIGGAVVMHMDVTERKLAEQRVELSERRQRAIIESSGDAILTLGSDGNVLSGNPASERILGRAEGELRGLNINALLPSFPFFQASFDFAPAVPPLFRGEFMGARKDGTRFPTDVVMSRVQGPDGDIYIVNIRDTSEQRTLHEQLVQASRLSTLGEMAAGMAHELNQPLSVMRMAADNALMRMERNATDPGYLAEVLDLVSAQCEKLGKLILNLRTFARREESAHRQVFNPLEAVEAACQLLHGKLALGSIDIILDLPPVSRPVRGSGNQLEQVIINLLSNAHDAILECRRLKGSWVDDHVRIVLRSEDAEGVVCIAVEDTGCGIAPEHLPKLFNPFFTTKGIGKGTGLGLSISYGIIASMGGTIKASNGDRGARFEITLPACVESMDTHEEQAHLAGLPLVEGDRR